MVALNKNENHDTAELKATTQHVEAFELGHGRHGTSSDDIDPSLKQHGDRALAIVGSERITLTEEDVRYIICTDIEVERRTLWKSESELS